MMRSSVFFLLLSLTILPTVVLAQPSFPGVNEFKFVDKEPQPLNMEEVKTLIGYPKEALDEDAEGTVIARILTDSLGRYIRHKIVSDPNPILVAAVEAHVAKLKFQPAILGGVPTASWVNIPFRFKLVGQSMVDLEKEINAITDSLTGDEENYLLWYRRGYLRIKEGTWEDAISDFEQSLQYNPRKNSKRNAKSYQTLFLTYYYSALANARVEKFSPAIADLTRAITTADEMKAEDSLVNSLYNQVYLDRATVYRLAEDNENAKKDFKWTIANDTASSCDAYQFLADIALEEENKEDLVYSYEGLIQCFPDNYLLRYSLGYYKSEIEQYGQAITLFDSVLANLEMIEIKLAAIQRKAYCQWKMGQTDQAFETIEQALKLNILYPQAYYLRGLIYMDQGRTQKGCEEIKKSITYEIQGLEREDAIQKAKEVCGLEVDE